MAKITTHTLSSVDGTHAGGVAVELVDVQTGQSLFKGETDEGGRLTIELDISQNPKNSVYELVLKTGDYFSGSNAKEIVSRFQMANPEGAYHMPFIIGPNGYSCWWSAS